MHYHKNKPNYINNIENTVVLESQIHGYGLFATKTIEKNTLLCVLTGQIVKFKELKKIMKTYKNNKELFIEKITISKNKVMLIPFRTKYSFINHSEKKEMIYSKKKKNKFYIYATVKIKKNEEIVSKYNLKTHIDVLNGFKN